MSTILAQIFCIMVALFAVGSVLWFITLPWSLDRQYERYRIYGDDKPLFKLRGGVLTIDWKTFGLNRVKRFIARHFPKVAIVLESGKELYFYNGIQGKSFTYEGKLSFFDELQYNNIEKYIR